MERMQLSSLSSNQVPRQLVNYMSLGDWATFQCQITAARKEIDRNARLVELGVCFVTCLCCVVCFHSCVVDIMDSGKVEA